MANMLAIAGPNLKYNCPIPHNSPYLRRSIIGRHLLDSDRPFRAAHPRVGGGSLRRLGTDFGSPARLIPPDVYLQAAGLTAHNFRGRYDGSI
jgi:hypothetical protein